MKTYYYYATTEMKRFDEPQDQLMSNCRLTKDMIERVVAECAVGEPPFKLYIPRNIAWRYSTWDIPSSLISVRIIPGNQDDITACDVVWIVFEDCEAQIVYRRERTAVPIEQWDYGTVKA